MMPFAFRLVCQDDDARRGELTLAHGVVPTPAFMPVGTRGAIKGATFDQLEALGADIALANTYHLHLRPTDTLIGDLGGLHRFTSWTKPLLTDSGGYQVFSLADRRTISEAGVAFRSHLDGAALLLTPENVVDIQARLGSDVAMVFDECPAWPATRDVVEAATDRTLRWAERGRRHFLALASEGRSRTDVTNAGQAQFGIIQGGTYADLRQRSVEGTLRIGFEAYAVGGLSVGEPPEIMYEVAGQTARLLPADRPRYLMGVGTPPDLVECVARGIDLFDCVLPTRNARNGQLFTRSGPISIKNARFARDERPVDDACGCPTCRRHSRAYLRHLFTVGEMAAATLNTLHNLHFYLDTMRAIRKAIESGTFQSFRQTFHEAYSRQLPDAAP